jgi:hypothetical protein
MSLPRGLAVDPVVRAHERVRAAFADTHLEVRQIGLAEIALAHDGVERVSLRLGPAVNGEVLHRRDGLEVLRVVALKTTDELHRELAREERVLAVRLGRVPSGDRGEIDVRRPERQALISAEASIPHVLVMLCPRFVRE